MKRKQLMLVLFQFGFPLVSRSCPCLCKKRLCLTPPQGAFNWLYWGFKEFSNVDVLIQDGDEPGRRRKIMSAMQVVKVLVVRSVLCAYALCCPLFLTVHSERVVRDPITGLLSPGNFVGYRELVSSRMIVTILAAFIALLELLMIVDAIMRLHGHLRRKQEEDIEKQPRLSQTLKKARLRRPTVSILP